MNNIKQFYKDIGRTARLEFSAVLSDPGVCIFFFLVPVLYPILYATIYNTEVVHKAEMVVVDEDNTALSRSFIRKIEATPEVNVIARVTNQVEAKDLVDRKEAYGCLIIPKGFQGNLLNGRQVKVSLISDLASVFYYKSFMVGVNNVALQMGRDLSAQRHDGGSDEMTKIIVRPIRNEAEALYNPQAGYASFLIPGVLILILQQTMLLGVCMLVGTARERRSKSYLLPSTYHQRGLPTRIVLGRSISYLFIYLFMSLWTLVIVPYIFRLPMLAKWYELAAFILPFTLAITFFAQTIAFFVRGREDTIIYLVFTSVLFIFLSGVSWPLPELPGFWRGIGYLIPSVPATQGFVALNSYGAPLIDVMPQYITLWIQSLVYMIFASIGGKMLMHLYGSD